MGGHFSLMSETRMALLRIIGCCPGCWGLYCTDLFQIDTTGQVRLFHCENGFSNNPALDSVSYYVCTKYTWKFIFSYFISVVNILGDTYIAFTDSHGTFSPPSCQ